LLSTYSGEETGVIIEPKIFGNVCLTAHPLGCARQVQEQVRYVEARPALKSPRSVLVVGSSNGYGLAVAELWRRVTTENLGQLSDIQGFREEYLRYHGFGVPGVDYTQEVEP
jgi:trans-2-enoyl-CoA reductase